MKKLAKFSVLSAAITVSVVGMWSVANATGQEHMLATPFVAADQPTTPKYTSSVVSTGKRNPFSVAAKTANFSRGNYSGIIIESQDKSVTPRDLETLGFSYKGQGEAVIEYTGPQMVVNRASVRFGSANPNKAATSADGFTRVVVNTNDLGIPANSAIHKIVLAPPPGGVGRMVVDAITLNGDPVKSAMQTAFYQVTNNSFTGPLAQVAAEGCQSQTTSVALRNRTNRPVDVYFTLGVVQGCVTNVQQIFPGMTIVGAPTIGKITLQPQGSAGDQISSTNSSCYSGSFSADSVRINCATDKFPTGQSVAEFIVNNGFQGNFAQETIDISCVAGANAIWKMSVEGGQQKWSATTDTRQKPPKIETVSSIKNDDYNQNLNKIGVFPFGCTNCTDNAGVPCCAPPIGPGNNPNSANPPGCAQQGNGISFPPAPSTQWNPNPPAYGKCNPTYAPLCNVQRPASCNGGSLVVDYLGKSNTGLQNSKETKPPKGGGGGGA